jgi:hypothetical protein
MRRSTLRTSHNGLIFRWLIGLCWRHYWTPHVITRRYCQIKSPAVEVSALHGDAVYALARFERILADSRSPTTVRLYVGIARRWLAYGGAVDLDSAMDAAPLLLLCELPPSQDAHLRSTELTPGTIPVHPFLVTISGWPNCVSHMRKAGAMAMECQEVRMRGGCALTGPT